MIQQIMPEQVAYYWESIKDKVDETLPAIPGESDKLNGILTSLLNGTMICWISYRIVEERKKSNAFLITSINHDHITGVKSLVLYCLYVMGRADMTAWKEGFEAIKRFGASKGCTRLTAYTTNDFLVRMANEFDGGADYHFISIPI